MPTTIRKPGRVGVRRTKAEMAGGLHPEVSSRLVGLGFYRIPLAALLAGCAFAPKVAAQIQRLPNDLRIGSESIYAGLPPVVKPPPPPPPPSGADEVGESESETGLSPYLDPSPDSVPLLIRKPVPIIGKPVCAIVEIGQQKTKTSVYVNPAEPAEYEHDEKIPIDQILTKRLSAPLTKQVGQGLPEFLEAVPGLYVLDDESIRFLDLMTNQFDWGIPVVQPQAMAITADGAQLVATSGFGRSLVAPSTLTFIDTESAMAMGQLDVPVDLNPSRVAITPDGRFAYVVAAAVDLNGFPTNRDRVLVVDLGTRQIAEEIQLPGFGRAQDLVITPDGQRAFVVGTQEVKVIDLATNTVSLHIIVELRTAERALMHPSGTHLYAVPARLPDDSVNFGIGVVDAASMTLVDLITLPLGGQRFDTYDMAITPDGKTLLYADSGVGRVYHIDTVARRIEFATTFSLNARLLVATGP